MYQRVGQSAYKADLTATTTLMAYLGHPENGFKSVHVAGTNGKGSTSHMLASVFQEAGYKTGLYTSPHLKDFRERIKINGEMISQQEVVRFISAHKTFFENHQLSFFEMTVGLAFEYFKKQEVDIAIIETGMGGRLDSTNVITPEVSVITNIGLDHTQFLGSTLGAIAAEKAGIIKSGVPVVIGETQQEIKQVFTDKADILSAPIVFADDLIQTPLETDLKGVYQQKNIQTAYTVLNLLASKWSLSEETIEKGLRCVVKNTQLQGRWQILNTQPKVICDTGHNREGLTYVMSQLEQEKYKKLHVVLGVVSDKDLVSVLPLFPKDAQYYFCKPNIPRGMMAEDLAEVANKFSLIGNVFASVSEAYRAALGAANLEDLIFIGGSTFVVAEVL